MLTTETEAQLRRGYPLADLPKTFRDAVNVASHLSQRFIWIDSLCIFQDPDNLKDWQHEAAVMRQVYNNATFNIAATAAKDSSIGLFFERNTACDPFNVDIDVELVKVDFEEGDHRRHIFSKSGKHSGLYTACREDRWPYIVDGGHLNKRAWVMQERFLSRRILHFTTAGVYWECLENQASESFPISVPRRLLSHPEFDSGRLLKNAIFHRRDILYLWWQKISVAYTRCAMSKDSDKLVAIRGVQNLLSDLYGVEFVAGLWREYMLPELCWTRLGNDKSQPRQWRAPTWSWACKNQSIMFNWACHFSERRCSELRTRASVESIHVEQLESGQLKSASLTLRGKLSRCLLSGCNRADGLIAYTQSEIKVTGQGSSVCLDAGETKSPTGEEVALVAIYFCGCGRGTLDRSASLEALVLRRVNTAVSGVCQYERIGIARLEGQDIDIYDANEPAEEQSIVII